MKKILAVTLTLLLLVSVFAACSKSGNETTAQDTTVADTTSDADVTDGADAEESGEAVEKSALEEKIDAIYAIQESGLRVGTISVDMTDANTLKAYTGLDDASKISDVAVSEALIGSQAYSLVLVTVKDKADLKDVAQSMHDGINTRKWVCVEADDLRVAGAGDTVMLVMTMSEYDVTAAQLVDAFKTVSGGTLDVDLAK